jgi:hypothetical protein
MAKMGRPKENLWGKNKSRDPNRRRIVETQSRNLKGLSKEEIDKYKSEQHKEYLERVKEYEKGLEYLKEPPTSLRVSGEKWEDYYPKIKEKNKRRLDEILSDEEIMWRVFADRDDITTKQMNELLDKKREKKTYISDKEVDEVMNEIWGGIKRIHKEEEEENSEFKNPYNNEK